MEVIDISTLKVNVGTVPTLGAVNTQDAEYSMLTKMVPDDAATPISATATTLQWYDDGTTLNEPTGLLTKMPWDPEDGPYMGIVYNNEVDIPQLVIEYYNSGAADPSTQADRYISSAYLLYSDGSTGSLSVPSRALSLTGGYYERNLTGYNVTSSAYLDANHAVKFYDVSRGYLHLVYQCESMSSYTDDSGTHYVFTPIETEVIGSQGRIAAISALTTGTERPSVDISMN